MVFGHEIEGDLCFCGGADAGFEFFGEGLVVEEEPGVVEFAVEGALEVADGHEHVLELVVAHKSEEGRVDAVRVGVVGGVVVAGYSVEGFWWFSCGYFHSLV